MFLCVYFHRTEQSECTERADAHACGPYSGSKVPKGYTALELLFVSAQKIKDIIIKAEKEAYVINLKNKSSGKQIHIIKNKTKKL